jgi:transcriptional regulator GlxA family with amidase domain
VEHLPLIPNRDISKTCTADFALGHALDRPRLVLIVAVQPDQMLDIVAVLDAFTEANRVAPAGPRYEVRLVSGGPDRNLTTRSGLTLQASASYDNCSDIADTLLVVGHDARMSNAHKDQFVKWLRWQASRSRRVGTVSSGALLLAEAGLLNGKRATTHWQYQDTLAAQYPLVSLERDAIYVRDANLFTCAGATTGVDLALSMIQEDIGPAVATKVAQSMLLYLRRPGGTPQISAALRAQAVEAGPIAKLLSWLPGNLRENLSIRSLARRSAMSPRNFARHFRRQVGVTPAKHIESLRLEAAQFQLESSDLTIDGVAFAVGFESAETMRRVFIRRVGTTPGRYRALRARSHNDLRVPLEIVGTGDIGVLGKAS